jgi:thioredoxin reductase
VTAQVIVSGAGPAGLAAATAAARAGAAVLLLEERSVAGGQLRYRVQPIVAAPDAHAERPSRLLERLISEALAADADLRTNALVAGCFADRELLVVEGRRSWRITPDALIVTTGAVDLPYPFPGATFPGVFSAQGLQILLNQHRVRPGRRFAIIGVGAAADELAVDIMLAGGEVVWSGIAPAPFLQAEGNDGVRVLRVGQDRVEADIIVISVGRQADSALATMAGTPLGFSAEFGGLVPLVDERLQSPVAGMFVAGDAAGVGSLAAAIAEGRLAGVSAAASLGLASEDDVAAARAAGGPELASRIALRAALQPIPVQPL